MSALGMFALGVVVGQVVLFLILTIGIRANPRAYAKRVLRKTPLDEGDALSLALFAFDAGGDTATRERMLMTLVSKYHRPGTLN